MVKTDKRETLRLVLVQRLFDVDFFDGGCGLCVELCAGCCGQTGCCALLDTTQITGHLPPWEGKDRMNAGMLNQRVSTG